MKNYYRIIHMSRESFSKEKLEARYETFKKLIVQNYEMYKDKPKEMKELAEMEQEFLEAYSVLSDDQKRKEHDDLLDEEKRNRDEQIEREKKAEEEKINREREQQEKYSCFKMYDKSLIKSVGFRRNTVGKIFSSTYEADDDKTAKKVDCNFKGFVTYTTDWKKENSRLGRYEIETISTANPERRKYTVITPVIDYEKIEANPKYKKAIYEKLFSDKNLEKSRKENYEYLGRLVYNGDDYNIDYNKEEFCAAVRFGIMLKRRVDNPTKKKTNVVGKFKKTVRKIKEKLNQDEGR